MAVNDIVMGAAGASGPATYIEDVFSTYLYTGNSSTQTITNGIDLAGKGGLVWTKARNLVTDQMWFDTARGVKQELGSNKTNAQSTNNIGITAFGATGYTTAQDNGLNGPYTYASWTFRKQPKFFDIVTWTGDASGNRTLSHTLASTPGCIIIKATNAVDDWYVYHRSLGTSNFIYLNTTGASSSFSVVTAVSSTTFTVSQSNGFNTNGRTYVAYLFAHDAGGFGATGTDNVISCGSWVTDGTDKTIELGYEPQYILAKRTTATSNWFLLDVMRGFDLSSDHPLYPNTSGVEDNSDEASPTATGFKITGNFAVNYAGTPQTWIYIAIRRPMKTPTTGTEVFSPVARTGTGATATVTGSSIADAVLIKNRGAAVASLFSSRLTNTGYVVTSSTAAEVAAGATILQANPWDVMNGVKVGTTSTITNASTNTFINYLFTRAAGFFDVVCYTGTRTGGAAKSTLSHGLAAMPELIIITCRNKANDVNYRQWYVGGTVIGYDNSLILNDTGSLSGAAFVNALSSSTFQVVSHLEWTGATYVAYLFATCAGVSKVGNYTGNGSSQTIACGFTAGARFVLIKRTDSTGDWYVWDTARGIVAGNDPHLSLNTTAAEVTTDDSVDAASSGFIVNQVAATNVNVTSATYIFLAIA